MKLIKFFTTFLLILMIFQDQTIFSMLVYGSAEKEKECTMKLQSQIQDLKIHMKFLILKYVFPLDSPDKLQLQAFFPDIYDEIKYTINKHYTKDPECPLQIHVYHYYWMLPFLLSSYSDSPLDALHNIVYQSFQLTTSYMFDLQHKETVIPIDRPKWTVTMNLTTHTIHFVPDNDPKDGSHTMILGQFPLYTKFLCNDRLIEMKTLKDFKLSHVHLEQGSYSTTIDYHVVTQYQSSYFFYLKFFLDREQHLERIDCYDNYGEIESNATFKTKTYSRTDKSFGLREYTIHEGGDNSVHKIVFGFWVNTEEEE